MWLTATRRLVGRAPPPSEPGRYKTAQASHTLSLLSCACHPVALFMQGTAPPRGKSGKIKGHPVGNGVGDDRPHT